MISSFYASKLQLPRIPIKHKKGIQAFNAPTKEVITEVAYCAIDVGGHQQRRVYFYIVPRIHEFDLILGRPWLHSQDAYIDPKEDTLIIRSSNTRVRSHSDSTTIIDIKEVSAVSFSFLAKRAKRNGTQTFAASMADIEKALAKKKRTDPRTKLPEVYRDWLDVFDREQANKLPPHRGPGVDHAIKLIPDKNGNQPELPWGPLFAMSREELLVLRKTLTEYLDKGFIRVSSSPASAPVLFVKKPGGGLRFCCDYRGLNQLTLKDRYPLPLISETLANLSKAKWFTKLDVIAAFHNIRIAQGDEWKTAFRTRFGLFEWLVTPFGLANAPSTFQRYVNWVIRQLEDFVTAYVDDILIFTNGTQSQHEKQVKIVLQRLREAGLRIDIDKCEFSAKSCKYLGYIVDAEKGIRMDPQKVKAIMDWEAPRSVKGILRFLGFANFYRQFIRGFSDLAAPLHALTTKSAQEREFHLSTEAGEAFETLKQAFTIAPVLAQFDPDRETVVETDSSGWCSGATLSQKGDNDELHPVAFFSKKHTPAECNYEIYDKEMLAIIKALKEWNELLRSVPKFKIVTDHKNLEYFMTVRDLTERQMRYSLTLSRYDFTIVYRPGKHGGLPDALTRREQDLPQDAEDERLTWRKMRLIKPEMCEPGVIPEDLLVESKELPVETTSIAAIGTTQDLDELHQSVETLWIKALKQDGIYSQLKEAVLRRDRQFPTALKIRVSIADCEVDEGQLLFRGRRWVPDDEPLQTKLVQTAHDGMLTGHPGKEGTLCLMRRRYFWPGMDTFVKRFVRNCLGCGRNTIWRDRRKGLLKPLPIPERKWQELSMDFITKLPESDGYKNILVVTDRLGKGMDFIPLKNINAETLAWAMIEHIIGNHGLPTAIVSDRGTQIVEGMWSEICRILQIKQRLSTAFHPETDGSTERANQRVWAYLRHFVDYAQSNWAKLLPMAKLAINNQDAASTGVSPFFLDHGYHANTGTEILLPPLHREVENARNPREIAEATIAKLSEALLFAQASMAAAQETQERLANRTRDPAMAYKVGDKVWLDLRNVKTDRAHKKLSEQHAIFTVTKVVSGHAYKLDTPPGICSTFHTSLLRPLAQDPLPSQIQDDVQPPPIIQDDVEEWEVEEILDQRMKRGRGRGGPLRKEFLVKWVGYSTPTWSNASDFEDTEALDRYEARLAEENT
jgi:hypothetical protein